MKCQPEFSLPAWSPMYVQDLTFSSEAEGAGKPLTTVQDCVSTSVSEKALNIFYLIFQRL